MLRRITQRILKSAAVESVAAADNMSHGKQNGALRRLVFKVYLDDHEVQGVALDRGLKNNPVVCLNALFPVLTELSWGLRDLDEVISLKEFSAPDRPPRTGEATVREIVAANLAYVAGYFYSGDYRRGCRYYDSPDAFLGFFSDLVAHFRTIEDLFGLRDALRTAIYERREITSPVATSPLNLALRAIAAMNSGVNPGYEQRHLIARQQNDGGFSEYSPLYSLGTNSAATLYFGSAEQTTVCALRALSLTDPGIQPVGNGDFIFDLQEAI